MITELEKAELLELAIELGCECKRREKEPNRFDPELTALFRRCEEALVRVGTDK